MSSPPSTLQPIGLRHGSRHRVEGDDDLESLLRLAKFAEKEHSSLTGVGPNDHHVPTPNIAEGDYATWTIQAIYDTTAPEDANWLLGIRNDGNVVLWSGAARSTYIISPAGVLLATLTGEDMAAGGWMGSLRIQSILDRYILFVHNLWTELPSYIIVQEGIAELWTRNPSLDQGAYTLDNEPLINERVAISPSGEWIVAMVKEAVTGNGLIFIYKGS